MQNNIRPGHHDMNLSKHSELLNSFNFNISVIFKYAILLQFSEHAVFWISVFFKLFSWSQEFAL